MSDKRHFKRLRAGRMWMQGPPPHWWPEEEPWPPTAPLWKRARKRLFPRVVLGALTALFISTLICSGGIYLIQALTTGLDLPQATVLFGLGGALLLFLVAATIATRNMRRFFTPLDDLLDASDRLAAGEDGVQVREQGGPEARALIRSFNSMSKQIQRQNDERKDLLADVTHELRTPLTVIQGEIEGMLDGVYDRDDSRLVELLAETQRMLEMLEDLRTLALAERGALRFRKEPTDLFQLTSEIIATFRVQTEAEGIDLELTTAGELPLIALDPVRMGQVLSNLLANALRYTASGGRVQVALRQPASNEVQIAISDTGRGIPSEDLPHIFDRFYRSHDSEGSGLGLAIARQLVEAHGGQISAESEPGVGTTMRISVPI